MILLRLGVALVGAALALALDMSEGVPGRNVGVIVALVAGIVLALVAPAPRCRCHREPAGGHRPDSAAGRARPTAVTNVVALAGEPGTGESTDPGLGELRPVRTGRHAPR